MSNTIQRMTKTYDDLTMTWQSFKGMEDPCALVTWQDTNGNTFQMVGTPTVALRVRVDDPTQISNYLLTIACLARKEFGISEMHIGVKLHPHGFRSARVGLVAFDGPLLTAPGGDA